MKRFCTSYLGDDGFRYTDHVDANSWDEAQEICWARRPGELVDGVLFLEIPAEQATPDRIDELTKAMADTGYSFDDAPDASTFDRSRGET